MNPKEGFLNIFRKVRASALNKYTPIDEETVQAAQDALLNIYTHSETTLADAVRHGQEIADTYSPSIENDPLFKYAGERFLYHSRNKLEKDIDSILADSRDEVLALMPESRRKGIYKAALTQAQHYWREKLQDPSTTDAELDFGEKRLVNISRELASFERKDEKPKSP